jgi:hypothetical protein
MSIGPGDNRCTIIAVFPPDDLQKTRRICCNTVKGWPRLSKTWSPGESVSPKRREAQF